MDAWNLPIYTSQYNPGYYIGDMKLGTKLCTLKD